MDLLHVTIADSVPNLGTAIVISNGSLAMTNTIIANHNIAIENIGGMVSEDYNNFFDNTTDFSGTVTSGSNSLFGPDADPRFADPANDNYRLTEGSAALDNALDLGIPIDLAGNPRPQNGVPDRGAYEGVVFVEQFYYLYLPIVLRNN